MWENCFYLYFYLYTKKKRFPFLEEIVGAVTHAGIHLLFVSRGIHRRRDSLEGLKKRRAERTPNAHARHGSASKKKRPSSIGRVNDEDQCRD